MQTRRQAREAAELAAAVQAIFQPVDKVAPSPSAHNPSLVWAPSFASSLSDLTPTSSFVSDAGTVRADSLNTVDGTDNESNDGGYASTIAAAARAFGVPQTNTGKRSLRTPMQSQVYPQEVLETPRKNWRPRPTEEEQRAAQADWDASRIPGAISRSRPGEDRRRPGVRFHESFFRRRRPKDDGAIIQGGTVRGVAFEEEGFAGGEDGTDDLTQTPAFLCGGLNHGYETNVYDP